ncbi:Gfo/Idh/MocA family protein [Nonomuraea diastatica]|uniref:Gfo/Idh/MocA family protein n=1 Tax=Nonomuraea diastatica TaxID=1848329 RepID=UPI001FE33568|nr:Gfo/Idh/MocA family oxidoreductase [Nonomuraea diastatica]
MIGLGRVAQLHHLPNLAQSRRVEISAVCDLSRDLTAAVAHTYGLPARAVALSADDLMSRDLDAVLIANRHHAPLIQRALEVGLHVMVEKPVCWGIDEAVALEKLERSSRSSVVVGYMKRYDPSFARLLGGEAPPVLVRLHVFAGARHKQERLHQRIKGHDTTDHDAEAESAAVDSQIAMTLGSTAVDRVKDVRTLTELAVHDLNLGRTLVGPITVREAFRFATPFGPGFLAVMSASGTPVHLEVVPDFETASDWDETLTAFYPGAATELRFGSPFRRSAPTVTHERCTVGTDVVRREVIASYDSAYRLEVEHFIDCALDLAESRTPISDAVADLALIYEIAALLKDL